MFCSNCGKELPDGTKFCSACGAPMAKAEDVKEEAKTEEVKAEETKAEEVKAEEAKAEETKAEEPKVEEAKAEEPKAEEVKAEETKAEEPKVEEAKAEVVTTAEPKAKKSFKVPAIILGCVAAVAVIIGCVCIFARDKVGNAVHKTFDKPKDYYSYVEKKNLTALTGKNNNEYMTKMLDNMTGHRVLTETVKIRLGSRGKDFTALASMANIDLSWLDNAGITYKVSTQDDKAKVSIAPLLNDVKLATLASMINIKEGVVYLQVPELNEQWLGVHIGDEDSYEAVFNRIGSTTEKYEEILKAYPDQETIEALTLKYYEIIMEQVESMEKTKSKLEAGDVAQECTLLTMELKTKDIQKILKAVVKELKKDKEIEKIINNVSDAMMSSMKESIDQIREYNPDYELPDPYEEFIEALEEFEEEVLDDEEKIEIDKLILEMYVDGDGKIIGRTITVRNGDTTAKFSFAMTKKDDKIGIECSGKADSEGFSFVGNGTVKKEMYNGDFRLKVGDQKIMTVSVEDYDLKAAEKGNFAGSLTFKLGSDINVGDFLTSELRIREDNPAYALLKNIDPALRISGEMQMDKHELTLSLLDAGSEIIAISFNGSLGEEEDISAPAGALEIHLDDDSDEEKLYEYLKGMKFDTLLSNLREAKLPSEWIDELEEEIEYMMKELEENY